MNIVKGNLIVKRFKIADRLEEVAGRSERDVEALMSKAKRRIIKEVIDEMFRGAAVEIKGPKGEWVKSDDMRHVPFINLIARMRLNTVRVV